MTSASFTDTFGYSQAELKASLEHFIKTWAPEHQALRDQFLIELHMLHAKTFMAAQAPFLRAAADAFARQPIPPIAVNSVPTIFCANCHLPIFGDSYVVNGQRYGQCCLHKTHVGAV